jgi:hypothetical protein
MGNWVWLAVLTAAATYAVPAYAGCVSHDNAIGGYSYWVNHCPDKVIVQWEDQGHCRGGCGATIAASGRTMVTGIKGQYTIWVCNYQQWVKGACRFN